jgi:hypothetical protein
MGRLLGETDYSKLLQGDDASESTDWAHHIQPNRAIRLDTLALDLEDVSELEG